MDESLSVWFFAMFDENHSIHFKMIKDDNTVGAGIRSVHTKWIAYRPLQRILTNFTLFKGSLITILGNHYKFSRFTFPHTSMKCHFFGMVCHFLVLRYRHLTFASLALCFCPTFFQIRKPKAPLFQPHIYRMSLWNQTKSPRPFAQQRKTDFLTPKSLTLPVIFLYGRLKNVVCISATENFFGLIWFVGRGIKF